MKKGCIPALCTAFVMLSELLPQMPAAASETLLIRDKWGFCETAHYAESEHFVIFYGDNDTTGEVNDAFLKRNLENCETLWHCYTEYLGMTDLNTDIYGRSGQKYKTNIYLTYTGLPKFEEGWAFMSSEDGYGMEFISPKALLDDLTLAHEFGHVATYHQKAWVDQDITGAWWESLANWFREMYLMSDYYKGDTKTCWFEPYLRNLSLTLPHGRDYYEVWPFLVYLCDNPDNLPTLGVQTVKRLISEAEPAEFPLDTLTRLTGINPSDLFDLYARRMATFDFGAKDAYRGEFQKKLRDNPYFWNLFYSVPDQIAENTYCIPQEEAPMQCGINIIPLQITGPTISVTLKGCSEDSHSNWRASLVTVDASGNSSYSDIEDVAGTGKTCAIRTDNAKEAYLSVVAVPRPFKNVNAFHKQADSSYLNGTERRRYPYTFTLEGASVIQSGGYTKTQGHRHTNGGGWVADTASVADSVYVAPDAMVLGRAKLSGHVRVEDYAVVANDVTVKDNAVISGHAVVDGGGWIYVNNAWEIGAVTVSGNAVISDSAVVTGGCSISENAQIQQKAYLADGVSVSGNAVVKGMAYLTGRGNYSGSVMLDGDYANEENCTDGVRFGWQDQSYTPAQRGSTLAEYTFKDEHSTCMPDVYSGTAMRLSSTAWQRVRASAKGVLTFNGTGSYAELDDALFRTTDLQISLAALCKAGDVPQELLHLGDETAYMALLPSNEEGKAELRLSNGQTTERLTADAALPIDEWSKITIRLINGTASLLLNGKTIAEDSTALSPLQILSAAETDRAYLGKGVIAESFKGAVDYICLYQGTADEPDIQYTADERPVFGDLTQDRIVGYEDIMWMIDFLRGLPDFNFESDFVERADLNGDGVINSADFSILKRVVIYGQQTRPAKT